MKRKLAELEAVRPARGSGITRSRCAAEYNPPHAQEELRGRAAAIAPLSVIILAAGEGKRMKSALPKVLQPLAGQPLLQARHRDRPRAGSPRRSTWSTATAASACARHSRRRP